MTGHHPGPAPAGPPGTPAPAVGEGRAVLVGAGFVGGAAGRYLRRLGWTVDTVARSRREGHDVQLDLRRARDRVALADLVRDQGYDRALLCHGPSDVTWCEEHPDLADEVHRGVAESLATAGVPVVLVSTDNVFPGDRSAPRPMDPVNPANHYGRAKLAAEQRVLDGGGRVARVSLVYGWSSGDRRRNFAEQCLLALAGGGRFAAPYDQVFTPVHVDDVAAALASLVVSWPLPTPIAHLAGPRALSRYNFAELCATALGAGPGVVAGVAKAATSLACRPSRSGLAASCFRLAGSAVPWAPVPPAEGVARMVRTWPR